MTYHDPRKRDPRFPDRPTHEDFVVLSEQVQRIDHEAEVDHVPLPEIVGVDMESLLYLLRQRMGLMIQRTGRSNIDPMDPMLMAIYMDAFTLGKRYAEARHGRPGWCHECGANNNKHFPGCSRVEAAVAHDDEVPDRLDRDWHEKRGQ
jgi:hypothetical protein